MKYYTFNLPADEKAKLLADINLKKVIREKISFNTTWLMVGISHRAKPSVHSYILLKYGHLIVSPLRKDFAPQPNVDYTPKRNG